MFSLLAGATLLSAAVASPVEQRQASKFQYYNLTTPLASPCDLTTGHDGKIYADTFTSNKIVQIDREAQTLTEYDIPYTLPVLGNSVLPSSAQGIVALSCVVQPGEDGKIYAAAGVRNEFVRFDPATNEVKVFPTGNPLGNLQPFNDAWPWKTGMFFSQTTGNVINLFDYNTTEIRTFNVPTPLAGPLGMIVASDGNLWFVEMIANKMAKLDTTTWEITEYPLCLLCATPSVMRAETEGRYLWFTAIATNSIGRFDMQTGESVAYSDPRLLATPIEDTVDCDGNIWYSSLLRNTLNYFTPSTGQFTEISQPDESVTVVPAVLPDLPPAADIAVHYEPSDDSIWFTELVNNRVGKYSRR